MIIKHGNISHWYHPHQLWCMLSGRQHGILILPPFLWLSFMPSSELTWKKCRFIYYAFLAYHIAKCFYCKRYVLFSSLRPLTKNGGQPWPCVDIRFVQFGDSLFQTNIENSMKISTKLRERGRHEAVDHNMPLLTWLVMAVFILDKSMKATIVWNINSQI